MCENTYKIRVMTIDEIDLVIDWAAKEGWNPGLYDKLAFCAVDPEGFLVGELNNKPVACISVVAYDNKFAFLGFYIVKPEYRGMGYGLKLWNRGMKYLADRNVGLDGVVAQQDNYKKSGFKFAYNNIRYEGVSQFDVSSNTVALQTVPFEEILRYDNIMFPVSRRGFLKQWLNLPESYSSGVLKDNKLAGYGLIRKCRNGYKIGPLFADNEAIATELFYDLTAHIPGETFYLDTPEPNKAAVKLAESHNMKMVFETARMYTGKEPDIPLSNIFGVTTFELG